MGTPARTHPHRCPKQEDLRGGWGTGSSLCGRSSRPPLAVGPQTPLAGATAHLLPSTISPPPPLILIDARGLAAVSGTGGPNALWHVQVASEFLMASSASYEAGHFDPGVAHSRPGNATRSQDAISTSRWTRRTLAKGGANFERLVLGRPSTDLDDSKRHPRLLFTINSHAALETLLTRA